MASDLFLLELADTVPAPQLQVNVFLAAVHLLLLEGAEHELAMRYRSVCELRGVAFHAADDDAIAAAFSSFCRAYREPIEALCRVRATQTNEVGRCVVLRAVLGLLADRGDASVGLLDLGCSAGLNLFVDAYGYDYGGHRAGDEGATPVLACELRGAVPKTAIPRISARVGLDLSPIDVTDAEAARWLLACLWPDDVARIERLDAAIRVAAANRSACTLVRGDMVDGLASAAAIAGGVDRLVVCNCWSAAYLPAVRRVALADSLASLAATRPLTWVTMEHPGVALDLGVLGDVEMTTLGASAVCVTEYVDGERTSVLVAETHPHGAWLDWRSG